MILAGPVVHGNGLGAARGSPTANLVLRRPGLSGCWAGVVALPCGSSFDAVVYVGGSKVEAHLLGFEGDLYGLVVPIELVARIRPLEVLGRSGWLERIPIDVAAARAALSGNRS